MGGKPAIACPINSEVIKSQDTFCCPRKYLHLSCRVAIFGNRNTAVKLQSGVSEIQVTLKNFMPLIAKGPCPVTLVNIGLRKGTSLSRVATSNLQTAPAAESAMSTMPGEPRTAVIPLSPADPGIAATSLTSGLRLLKSTDQTLKDPGVAVNVSIDQLPEIMAKMSGAVSTMPVIPVAFGNRYTSCGFAKGILWSS